MYRVLRKMLSRLTSSLKDPLTSLKYFVGATNLSSFGANNAIKDSLSSLKDPLTSLKDFAGATNIEFPSSDHA